MRAAGKQVRGIMNGGGGNLGESSADSVVENGQEFVREGRVIRCRAQHMQRHRAVVWLTHIKPRGC